MNGYSDKTATAVSSHPHSLWKDVECLDLILVQYVSEAYYVFTFTVVVYKDGYIRFFSSLSIAICGAVQSTSVIWGTRMLKHPDECATVLKISSTV